MIERAIDPPLDGLATATVWNDSGGVGKTTVTINTADSLGRMGFDVLVIDLDPQTGSFTHHVGAVNARDQIDVTDILVNEPENLDSLLLEGDQPSLGLSFDLIPASKSLEDFSKALSRYDGNKIKILKSAIRRSGLGQEYDVLLIDAPGNRNLLVQNALVATQNALIPVEASPKGEASLDGLREYILSQEQVLQRDGFDSDIGVLGVVPSIVEGQLPNTKRRALKQYNERRENEGMPVTPFFLWKRNILEKAWENEQTLRDFIASDDTRDPRSNEEDLPMRFDYLANLVLTADTSMAEADFNDFDKL